MPYPGQRPPAPPKRFSERLIADWRQSWRFFSVQIGIGAGLLSSAIIAAAPGLIVDLLQAPLIQRVVVGLMLGAAVTFFPWLARIFKQGGRDGCD
jgi:H+/Cl- antiporter ClcA